MELIVERVWHILWKQMALIPLLILKTEILDSEQNKNAAIEVGADFMNNKDDMYIAKKWK